MEDDDDELENEESGEALEYGIQTFVWKRRAPMSLGDFDEFVSTKWPKGVVRAKGMCYFADEKDTCYLFEQSGKQFNITNAGQWYATMPADELADFLDKNPDVKKDWDPKVGDRISTARPSKPNSTSAWLNNDSASRRARTMKQC